ncbi:MAG: hypothetical protein ACP5JQ_05645 [Caldimicrobium sp.]
MRESLTYFSNLQKFFHKELEDLISKDKIFYQKLLALKEAISKTRKAYLKTNSFQFCEECAKKGVKCCGEGLEWKLSPEEFFLNLFLFKLEGKTFSLSHPQKGECLFLGEKGCFLILTPLFCRNFFCTELKNFLGEKNLIYLQNVLEEEALLTFELCEYLKRKGLSLGGF